eukprot:CAMPEP_0168194354 /NCGR_PEP_ID=MMETSP0139_2-20121125/19144_1 /TAXON_ID=44445 /ORGANISM="Pseudo-nitzschia australis, Strain 10249 10 AB" /LENGTH=741 /DNA_ID=CAMNT_0008117869 /DNA_START=179 /DNA_END=2404 /DNA_ORIENTATION=+
MNMSLNVDSLERREEAWDLRIEKADEVLMDLPNHADLKKKQKRTWKKPKDKPMRPLSAYNMFFQNQRERIVAGNSEDATAEEIEASVTKLLQSKTRGPKKRQDRKSHGQISFGDLARTIAAKWKAIDPAMKAIYNKFAEKEKIRYKKEVMIWKEKKESEHGAMMSTWRHGSGLLTSSTSLNDSMRSSLASSVASLSASLTSSYNPTDSMSSATHCSSRMGQEEVMQRQQDILRQQMGFVDSTPRFRIGRTHNGQHGHHGIDNVVQIPNLVERPAPVPIMQVPNDLDLSNRDTRNIEPRSFPFDDCHRNLTAIERNFTAIERNNSNEDYLQPLASDTCLHDDMSVSLQSSRHHRSSHSQQHQDSQSQHHQQQQVLLRLQEQQLQQLLQMQKARDETSRLTNISTTNTTALLNQVRPMRKSDDKANQQYALLAQRLQSGNLSESQLRLLSSIEQSERDQLRQLEEVTKKLDCLKQQQRRMNEMMNECCEEGNTNNTVLDDISTHSTMPRSININSSSNSNYPAAAYCDSSQHSSSHDQDFDSRQRMYGSFSDVNIVSNGGNFMMESNSNHGSCSDTAFNKHTGGGSARGFGQQQQHDCEPLPRNSFMSRTEDNNAGIGDNFGHSTMSNHHHHHQHQFNDHHDSIKGLFSSPDRTGSGGGYGMTGEQQLEREQQLLQDGRNSLARLLRMDDHMDMHGGRIEDANELQQGQPPSDLYSSTFQQGMDDNNNEDDVDINSIFKQIKD